MAAAVWLVRGHWDNVRGWLPFEAPQDTELLPDDMLNAVRLTNAGQFLPVDQFPTDNYPVKNDDEGVHRKRIPQIFASGFTFVYTERADALRQFIRHAFGNPDRTTPVPGEFFYLSQGNKKDAFLQERSPDAINRPGGIWSPPPIPVDDQLAFSRKALEGPEYGGTVR